MTTAIDTGLRPETRDVVSGLLGGALVTTVYLGACTGTSFLLLGLTTYSGSLVSRFRYALLLALGGLHGNADERVTYTDSSSNDSDLFGGPASGFTFTFGLTPLLVLAVVLAAAYVTGRAAERRRPSATTQQAALRALLTAGVVVAVVAVLTHLLPISAEGSDSDGDHVTVTPGSASMVLYGLPLLFLAGFAARAVVKRRKAGLPALRVLLASRTAGVSSWTALAGAQAASSGLLLTLAGIGYLIVSKHHEAHDLAGSSTHSVTDVVLIALALVPNAALLAAGFFMGMSLTAGRLGVDQSSGHSIGLVHGSASGLQLLWVLAPLAVALAVGVGRALRRPAGGRVLADWWQAGLGSTVAWLLIGTFVSVDAGLAPSTFERTGGLGDRSLSFTALTVVVTAFLWGAGTVVVGRLAAGTVVRVAPGVARRLGGRSADPSWEAVRPTSLLTPVMDSRTPVVTLAPVTVRAAPEVLDADSRQPVSAVTLVGLVGLAAAAVTIAGVVIAAVRG